MSSMCLCGREDAPHSYTVNFQAKFQLNFIKLIKQIVSLI